MPPLKFKTVSYLFDNALEEIDFELKQIDDLLYVANTVVKSTIAQNIYSGAVILQRVIDCIEFLKERVREQTKYSMESFHLDWLNDVLCASLYIIEPSDFVARAKLAVQFNIKNFDNLGFAFWPRRMGKSFAIIMGCVVILFCIPSGSMVVQSLNIKSALLTITTATEHVVNLFDFLKLPAIDPIRTFSQNGTKFINWYGAQEILRGREDLSNLPLHCYSEIKLISGNEDAGRGITVHIYLLDEAMFMKEGAIRTTLLNTRRSGTIAFCVSSEDPKNKNPILARMQQISDITTVSIYETICKDCQKMKLTHCMHRSAPAWNSNSRRLDKILRAFLMGDSHMNMLELYGSSILQNGNAYSIPEYESVKEFTFSEPLRPFQFLFAVIDPSTSQEAEGSFTCYVLFGLSKYEPDIEQQKFNVYYVS